MTLLAEPKAVSIDEFMSMPDSARYELVEGRLIERKQMGALSDYVAQQVARRLGNFCEERNVGYVFGSETTYRCFDDPNTGRRADVSFVRRDRLPDGRIPEGYLEFPPDLAVEVISPHDTAYEVGEKATLYLRHGYGEVWLVYPNLRAVHVYRRDQPILTVAVDQTLVGRGPLEGFACPVERLFPAPA